MKSQKNNGLKYCIKCDALLTDENWLKYLQKRSAYQCTPCFRDYGKNYHKSDEKYNEKQRNRHRGRRSAIICSYGDQCVQCGENKYEKLTIDHVNGRGTQHRKEMTTNIIDYLYNNKVDKDGYQVLCYNCNCSKNLFYKDKYYLRDKEKVISKYGVICAECKEDRIERLTIDHINNDGALQRRQLKCGTGVTFYRYLIKNNYPNLGLQVLCYNCNCGKITI